MFTKKHHIVRKTIIVLSSFILGIVGTVIVAATYDANIQNRAGSMLRSIKSNANSLPSSEKIAYYTLVHNNIQTLIQVLTGVDTNVMIEAGTTTGLDDGSIMDQIMNTGTSGTGIVIGTGVTATIGTGATEIATGTINGTGTGGNIRTTCGSRPSMGNPQSMEDFKAYMLQNYLESKCTDYVYSSTNLVGLEGTIQLSGDAAKLVCDASTNYKWIFPNSIGLIPNGVHSCKVSDKCSPVPIPSKTGRKYTKTTYGFYSDEIVQTCSEAKRGNGGGVYMEGSYPKCDASTNYKWTKLEYSEIGNTCDAKVATVTSAPAPTCVDLQYEFQCNQAMNGNYKKLIYSNGNTENITKISDCTATTFSYMTASSPTGWNGYVGAGWKACSVSLADQESANATASANAIAQAATDAASAAEKLRADAAVRINVTWYQCGNKEKDSSGKIIGLKSTNTYTKTQWNADARPIGFPVNSDNMLDPSGSSPTYTSCDVGCTGSSSSYATLCGPTSYQITTETNVSSTNPVTVTNPVSSSQAKMASTIPVSTNVVTTAIVSVPELQKFDPVTQDIVYKGVNKLDLYMPVNVIVGKKIPVYVYVHGGGWMSGDKRSSIPLGKHFTNHGIAYIPIDYTLSSSSVAGSKTVYQEIDCSLKWVMFNKDKYNFDTSNINMIGGSAGGHLILQYALNQSAYNDMSCPWGNTSISLNQIVDMAGPTDLLKDFSKTGAGDMNFVVDDFLGAKRTTSLFAQRAQENSPMNYINKDNKHIKYYLYHALNDTIVNYDEHTVPLYKAMKANNYSVRIDNEANGHDIDSIPDAGFLRMFNQ